MLLVIGATLWLLVTLAAIFHVVKAPRRLNQGVFAILCLELVFLVIASSTAECYGGPCSRGQQITEASGLSTAIVTYVIPSLAAAFTVFAIAYGLRHHRRTAI